MPFWFEYIVPSILLGHNPLVVAHGNSLRGIIKEIKGMSEDEILEYNIPTGVPLVIEFDKDMNIIDDYFMLDEEEVKKR
jgi:2,3-bisphosphoglycerate-dependent phosphoglycerate mutase